MDLVLDKVTGLNLCAGLVKKELDQKYKVEKDKTITSCLLVISCLYFSSLLGFEPGTSKSFNSQLKAVDILYLGPGRVSDIVCKCKPWRKSKILTWPIFDNTAQNNKKPAERYENSTYKLKLLPVLKLHLVFHVSGKEKKGHWELYC